MSSYLLLRDNKQTGPFSLEDLLKTGFKKYDLVWVEGKSAAWRYPGEIVELKAYAPAVEEQPFDRFFKKSPASETKQEDAVSISEPKFSHPKVEHIYPASSRPVFLEVGDKKIYASLPVNNKNNRTNHAVEAATTSQTFYRQTSQGQDAFGFGLTDSGPLHEGPNLRKEAKFIFPVRFQSGSYLLLALLGGLVISILAAGIFIGMRISKSDSHTSQNFASNDSKISSSQTAALIEMKPGNKVQELNTDTENQTAKQPGMASKEPIQKSNSVLAETHKSTKSKVNANRIADPALTALKKEPLAADSGITIQGYSKRQSQHRGDLISEKPTILSDISNMVSISANKYSIGTFGGLSDIQLTVNNKSAYSLDLVLVEVQYVQANKKIYKTENLYYRNVGPGESIMQEAPKSSRGIKILYRVTVVNSKEASLSYSGT